MHCTLRFGRGACPCIPSINHPYNIHMDGEAL
jgi:hypothetical protein